MLPLSVTRFFFLWSCLEE